MEHGAAFASLQGDQARLALANLGPVACPLAQTLAGWARFGVDRAARQILGSPLVRIETMGGYSCRNVAGTSAQRPPPPPMRWTYPPSSPPTDGGSAS
ncbi:extensin family protein [Novosphingobium sp.]|uniref:extensin family protein n=1 Tax=Novosphingobium sp. TaxID=1874826 RepID=UPI0034339400